MADLNGTGICTTTFGGAGALQDGTKHGTGTCTTTFGGAGNVTVNLLHSPTGTVEFAFDGAGDVKVTKEGRGRDEIRFGGNGLIGFNWAPVGRTATTFDGAGALGIDGQGMTVQEVVESVLSMFGMCCDSCGDPCLLAAIIGAVNASHQLIFSQAHTLSYFNRQQISVTVPTGGSVVLPKNVQNILGPARFNSDRRPLSMMTDRSQFESFIDVAYGGVAPNAPRGGMIVSENEGGGDNVKLTLFVTPAPASSTDFLLDVSLESPRYTVADIVNGTPVELPHKYAELLLLPLVRYWATSQRQFTRKEMLPQITQQYETARTSLGLVEPETEPQRRSRPPAKEDAAK